MSTSIIAKTPTLEDDKVVLETEAVKAHRDRVKYSKNSWQLFQHNPQDFRSRFVTVNESCIHYCTPKTIAVRSFGCQRRVYEKNTFSRLCSYKRLYQ